MAAKTTAQFYFVKPKILPYRNQTSIERSFNRDYVRLQHVGPIIPVICKNKGSNDACGLLRRLLSRLASHSFFGVEEALDWSGMTLRFARLSTLLLSSSQADGPTRA